MKHPDWKTLIQDCLASTTFMSMATHGAEGLWNNPVYFASDNGLSLYFISQLDCRHMRNIASSGEVACTIFPTNQTGDVFGVYVKGAAKLLEDAADKKQADNVYYGRIYPNDPDGKVRDKDGYRIDPSWYFVRIDIRDLWYFDTRYFKENRMPVPLDAIK